MNQEHGRQFCYVLSASDDRYATITFLSASLLKRLYPDAAVVLLVDEVTRPYLNKSGHPVTGVVSRVLAVETAMPTAVLRSRFLKTTMRRHLTGDFIFLDSDTLPIRRFDELFRLNAMAAVLNMDRDGRIVTDVATPFLGELGLNATFAKYYNTGVLFMPDTEVVREFGEKWHALWRELYERFGQHMDQPSFNSVLESSGLELKALDKKYNAMVELGPRFVRGGKIFHYWVSTSESMPRRNTLLRHLLDHYNDHHTIDWDAVDVAAKAQYPWIEHGESARDELAAGQYLESIKLFPSWFVKRVTDRVLGRQGTRR